MLRDLLAIWRTNDPMREMHKTLVSMVEKGEGMFAAVWETAVEGQVPSGTRETILLTDVEVNKAERSIRKRLVEHLVAQPCTTDFPACLVLMSVVKDAERVGDYCKDILDAAEMEAEPLSRCGCFGEFQAVYEDVRRLFAKTRRSLAESDRNLAEEVMLAERDVASRCEELMDRLLQEDVACRAGIPWALIARYLWRMAGHLSNLASGLVMPVHKLDYHDEKWLRGDKE